MTTHKNKHSLSKILSKFHTKAPSPKKGLLVMASASLGHAADIPARSLESLRSSDLVIFEEDRVARQWLKAAGIHRDYLKLSEHQETETLEAAAEALSLGKSLTYMSDQGTPNLADPGRDLLQIAYALESRVMVIPGPSSITAALAACPFAHESFLFAGFLPREPDLRLAELRRLQSVRQTLVILDTPYRFKALLQACSEVFPSRAGRQGFVALDISGPKEDYWLGGFEQLLGRAESLSEKLNFVLIIEGPTFLNQ